MLLSILCSAFIIINRKWLFVKTLNTSRVLVVVDVVSTEQYNTYMLRTAFWYVLHNEILHTVLPSEHEVLVSVSLLSLMWKTW